MRRTALLTALALLTVLPAPSASAAETDRLAGGDRIGTAVAIAERAFPDGADSVYLARADVLSDALVAGTLTDGPILLVPSCGEIPPGVTNQVERLGPDEVVALGGEQAICDATLNALGAGADTSRLAGTSRTATAIAIGGRAFPDGADTVYLADAADSPDAIAGGSLIDGPILLVPSDGAPAPTVVDTVDELDPAEVVALGGTTAVGDDVLGAAAAGRPVGRLAGDSRFDTAAAIAGRSFPATADVVYLARADVFADAVAAGSLPNGPVLLVPSCGEVPAAVTDAIARLNPGFVIGLGGEAAVCDELLAAAAGQQPPEDPQPPPPSPAPTEYCVDDPAGDVDDPRADIIRFCLTYGDTVRATLQVAQPVDPFTDPGWVSGQTGLSVLFDPEGGREGVEDFSLELGHGAGGETGLAAIAFDPFTGDFRCVGTAGFNGSRYVVEGFDRSCIGAPERFLFGVEFGYETVDTGSRALDRLGSFPPSIPFPPSAEPPGDPSDALAATEQRIRDEVVAPAGISGTVTCPEVPVLRRADTHQCLVEPDNINEAEVEVMYVIVRDDEGGTTYEYGRLAPYTLDDFAAEGFGPDTLCRDFAASGYIYFYAALYWFRAGEPDLMDADLNGIPCETVYPAEAIDGFWTGAPLGSYDSRPQ